MSLQTYGNSVWGRGREKSEWRTRMVGTPMEMKFSSRVNNDLYTQEPTVLNLPKAVLQQPSSRSNENLSLTCLYMQQNM